ncbi:MAG: hypothetical protein K2M06_01915 [Muribaculaceae bacterium]|nr:hypothetical protein [Muribaculaceae bacterium]
MALTKAQIYELQGHFNERGRWHDIAATIRCNLKESSFFFAYKDSLGNRKYLNLPIAHEDILAIINNQIENKEKDIIELTTTSEDFEVIIMNGETLEDSVADYKSRYPDTYTSLVKIREILRKSFMYRLEDGQRITDDYHIEVCSDWQDKMYVFKFLNKTEEYLQFEFKEIFKL